MLFTLSFENFIFVDFLPVKFNRSDVKPGSCVTVNTRGYRHSENILLILNRISTIWWKWTEILKSLARLDIKTPWNYEADSWFAITYNTFNRQKVHEDKIFERQEILQFLSRGSKHSKYVKFPTIWYRHFKAKNLFIPSFLSRLCTQQRLPFC